MSPLTGLGLNESARTINMKPLRGIANKLR
jgi:hypothetical protein